MHFKKTKMAGINDRIATEDFNKLRERAKSFIRECIKPTRSWYSVYNLKQEVTDQVGYFYREDMYELLKSCGHSVKRDEYGRQYCKAGLTDEFLFTDRENYCNLYLEETSEYNKQVFHNEILCCAT